MKSVPSVILLAVTSIFAGCAFLTAPKEIPVQQGYVGSIFGDRKANVFSLTSERRTVLVMRKMGPDEKEIRFCAEPPPDVAESLTSTLRAVAEATLKSGDKLSASSSPSFTRASPL